MGVKARTLRGVIRSSDICNGRFKEAEALAKSIFNKKRHQKLVPLPFFTEHGSKHCKKVEKYLNEIIWKRKEKSKYDFIPNAQEAMYLLSAVCLHDIGMWYGLWDNEDPNDLTDIKKVVQLREDHEQRTARYIQEKWSDSSTWSQEEKEFLSSICLYHRSKHPISTFEPSKIDTQNIDGHIRFAVLAGILRLADAWHVDETRAPTSLMNLYISVGMHQDAHLHWERAGLIREVEKDEVDTSSKKIKVTGHYPEVHYFDLGEFDLKDVGEIICDDIRIELRSVQQLLAQYPNTSFIDVKHEFRHIRALAGAEQRYLALWPYLLNKLSSSTATTAALVEVLLFAAERRLQNRSLKYEWRGEISKIINKILDSHPFDFMIRNLCKDVEIQIEDKTASPKSLSKYLRGIKKRIKENRDKMAGYAVNIIDPGDFLVVYGHSTNTLRLIEEVPQRQNRHLYILECYRQTDTNLKEDEDKKITSRIDQLGFGSVRFVHFHAFAQAMAELKQRKKTCKLLIGTHGVVEGSKRKGTKKYICKTGSGMVATIAKESGVAEVIVFAETEKVLRNGLVAKDIAGPDKLFLWDDSKIHHELGIMYLPPTMDILTKSVVDYYVNEKGIFYAKSDRRVGLPVSGRKESSLT